MFKEISFIKSISQVHQAPKDDLPEIILCGRSNVGKSSFINSFFNRKNIAKTSSSPGKTRTLNYYLIESKFYLVDLPGFGYAKVSKKEKEEWQRLIEQFILSSDKIKYAFHFIDSRHKPTQLDILLNQFLEEVDIPYSIVLSKVDKLKQSEKSKAKKIVIDSIPVKLKNSDILMYSTMKNIGRKEVFEIMRSF
jgi:GTP-binding protein